LRAFAERLTRLLASRHRSVAALAFGLLLVLPLAGQEGSLALLGRLVGQGLLLAAGADWLLRRAETPRLGAAASLLFLLLAPMLEIQALDPASLLKRSVALLLLAAAGIFALARWGEDWRRRRPLSRQRRLRARVFEGLLLGLGALGLLLGWSPLLLPLLFKPQLVWLRGPAMRPHLVWSTALLALLVAAIWVGDLNRLLVFDLEQARDRLEISLDPGLAGTGLKGAFSVLSALGRAWLILLLPLGIGVAFGRLLSLSRIRTKLALNALLTGVLPQLLLVGLLGSLAVVVLGSYRARLVRAQLDERMESCRLVTAWFAQAWSDPLDRPAQRRFEQQIRSLGDDSHLSRAFFSLYLPSRDNPTAAGRAEPGSPADSLPPPESWERLVSTWRMPSDFPLERIELPGDWRQRERTGLLRVGSRALHAAVVELDGLLALGFFPLDAEALEQIGRTLGTGISVVALPDREQVLRFGFNQIGLNLPCRSVDLGRTSDFPGPDAPLRERLFRVGLSRLDNPAFALDAPDEQLLVQVEALPARILPVVFLDERIVSFPYVVLLILQLLVLAPLLAASVWVAWMLNLRITRSIAELRAGTDALAAGDLEARIPEGTRDELGRLAASFNAMSARIRANIEALAEKERLEREMSIARTIQQGLLPERPPEFPGLELACSCRMALEVGGDYIDFLVTPGGELAIALGDVAGKGVAGALLMSNLQAAWRSLAAVVEDPGEYNRRLNEQLAATTSDELFVTFVQGAVRRDGERLWLRYSNAGHNPPLLLREGRLRSLEAGGLALGMFRGMPYEDEELELRPGDWLLLYTDGLTEALNSDEEEYGVERLARLLLAGGFDSAGELIERLLEAVEAFEAGAPRLDDLSLMVIRVNEDGPGHEVPDDAS
jgi:serine phosphatase RsbU (regulator of sigma subunit)